LNNFKIAETDSFSKTITKAEYKKLYMKIKSYVYPLLKQNPYFGPNIKRLKGELSDYYRYRIGDYRLFYKIEEKKIIIFILDIRHRKDAYK
jgi:mRNA interferase RelE/StbE